MVVSDFIYQFISNHEETWRQKLFLIFMNEGQIPEVKILKQQWIRKSVEWEPSVERKEVPMKAELRLSQSHQRHVTAFVMTENTRRWPEGLACRWHGVLWTSANFKYFLIILCSPLMNHNSSVRGLWTVSPMWTSFLLTWIFFLLSHCHLLSPDHLCTVCLPSVLSLVGSGTPSPCCLRRESLFLMTQWGWFFLYVFSLNRLWNK